MEKLRIRDSLKAAEICGMGVRLSPDQVALIVEDIDLVEDHRAQGDEAYDRALSSMDTAMTRLNQAIWFYCLSLANLIAIPALIYWWGV